MAPGGIVDPLTGLRIDDDDGADPPPSVSHRASSSKPRRRKGKGTPSSGAAPADDDSTPSDRGASKGKPARRRGRGKDDDSDSADDDPRGSSVGGVDRVDRGSEGRKRGARRSSHHAPRPGEVGFEGLDDGGRSQSLYKGMSRVAVKRLLERKAAEAAGDPARAQPPLDVPAVTAGIFDACAHLHLAVRRACDAARVPHTLDDAWRLAERATTRPPVHAIVHSVCDVKSLDPSYGASTYRSWERLRARRDENNPGPDPSDGEDSNPPPPDAIRMAFGIHPREAAGVNPAALLPRVAGYVRETRAAAVGVVGLDYAVAGDDVDARTTQMEVLEGMLGIARGDVQGAEEEEKVPSGAEDAEGWVPIGAEAAERVVPSASSSGAFTTSSSRSRRPSASRPLPVLVTSAGGADADADLLAALVRHRDACASAGSTRVPAFLIDASPDLALAALAALPDALLAFTGAVTFSKSKRLHETAFDCPMDRVALASECPEKVPAELAGRGARGAPEWSHPATLAFAAARVAAVKGRGITADDVVAAAARNSARAFRDEDEDERTPTRDEI